MKIVKALENYSKNENDTVIFLAGSCSGTNKNWRNEVIKFLENIAYGLISLHNLSMKKCLCVVKTYSDFIDDLNISKVYETFKDNNIEVYKGAYNIKSVLLKGGCNE